MQIKVASKSAWPLLWCFRHLLFPLALNTIILYYINQTFKYSNTSRVYNFMNLVLSLYKYGFRVASWTPGWWTAKHSTNLALGGDFSEFCLFYFYYLLKTMVYRVQVTLHDCAYLQLKTKPNQTRQSRTNELLNWHSF